jgi:electron transport complex protein RnfD
MNRLYVSSAPHVKDPISSRRIMLDVVIALAPAVIASALIFGYRALIVTCVCVAVCVFFEWAYQRLMKRPVTIGDFSAVITGILLAFNLPVTIPIWQAVFGCFIAIVLVKQLFGGLGKNFANPAITGRITMFHAFSSAMTTFSAVGSNAVSSASQHDAVSYATPLALISGGRASELPSLGDMLLGIRGGVLGETCIIALLLGGAYLLIRKVISWHTPVCYIATVFIITALLGQQPVYQVLSGGLVLGAFFMATDYVTSPQTNLGRVVFGIGAGLFTVLFRVYGSFPEGVSYSILLMNILTPYINKFTANKALGGVTA